MKNFKLQQRLEVCFAFSGLMVLSTADNREPLSAAVLCPSVQTVICCPWSKWEPARRNKTLFNVLKTKLQGWKCEIKHKTTQLALPLAMCHFYLFRIISPKPWVSCDFAIVFHPLATSLWDTMGKRATYLGPQRFPRKILINVCFSSLKLGDECTDLQLLITIMDCGCKDRRQLIYKPEH